MNSRPLLCLLAGIAACSVADAAQLHRYQVVVGESLDRFQVRACFDGAAPPALVAETSGAAAYLEQFLLPGNTKAAPAADGRLVLGGLADNACVDYRVKLAPARGGAQSGGPETRWVGRDLLTAIGDWMWRPDDDGAGIEVSFKLPDGVSVSAPWRRIAGAAGRETFVTGSTPAGWSGVVAVGRFGVRELEVPGATLHLALLDGPTPGQRAGIERWVTQAALNAATLLGRFPVEAAQVIVAPTLPGRGPVPWAYVSRGGGPGVHLFIDPGRPLQEFERDWTATHEMSHLFLPYLVARDVWLAEGLPTYLQNTLMVRGGAIEEREGWRRMIVEFDRRAKAAPGLSLAQASERAYAGMGERVRWAGAALLLEADLRLRELTGGLQSLDTALAAVSLCCRGEDRRWTAAELVEQLDLATGTTVFSDVLLGQLGVAGFPDYRKTLIRAGVTVAGGEVRIDPASPRAAAREAIMHGTDPELRN